MKEVQGDVWTYPADWRVITTNGYVKRNGSAVMGRGIAKEAALRFPDLPNRLGAWMLEAGNVVGMFHDLQLISFPVKTHWAKPAEPWLIKKSLLALAALPLDPTHIVALPRPGCGNGWLFWTDIRPFCAEILTEDRFVIVDRTE